MFELLGILFGLALAAALFTCTIVLPIVAFLRTRELSARLERLERELWQLRRIEVLPTTAVQPAEALPVTASPEEERLAAALPAAAELTPVAEAAALGEGVAAFDLEAWIGRHGLGWVAVILLLFATAFFLKYAFDNEWVGELGRVAIGVAGGVGLCVAGFVCHRRGWRLFSQMLSAGGVVLLYLASFAAFGYYHLLPQNRAAGFLVVLIAETAALAILYEAPAIALMAVIGGLLNPILLRTEHDQYRNLFIYLSALNAGVVGLALFRPWRAIGTVALLGTQGLFWGWYHTHYHPEKLAAALAFQTALFALFLVYSVLAHGVRPRRADLEDLARLVLNACLYAAAAYVLLDDDYHVLMGTFAVVLSFVYTVLAWFLMARRPDDERQQLVILAVALGFLGMVFPLQAQSAWITVGWAIEGLALWWFGLRVRARALQGFGAIFLVLAVGRFLFIDTPGAVGRGPFIPLFNTYGLPAAVLAACVFGAAASSRQYLHRLDTRERTWMYLASLTGVFITWLLLSKEAYDFVYTYYEARPFRYDVEAHRAAQTALSVVWAVYATLLLGIGFRIRSGALRWSALALFALTLGKAFFVDMARLPGFYRVAAFFVLALMMAAAAWGYQKFLRLANSRPEGGL